MPNIYFNKHFLTAIADLVVEPGLSCAQRIYFTATDTDDTAKQLRDFKLSEGFPSFKKEYEELLDSMNQWCIDQNIQLWLQPDLESEAIPSFELFKSRLFGPENYYDIREVLFFHEGKKSLEKLLSLLGQEHIPLEGKKLVLKNLQADIGVCADGTSTNIIDAAKDLGAFLGVYPKIEYVKRRLIQQRALLFIKSNHGETAGNEIHYVNAYYNHVAASYGLELEEDNFIDALRINEHLLHSFLTFLEAYLTPNEVLECLINEINKELLYLREKLSAQFFTEQTQRVFTKELQKKLEEIIADWNKRYSPLATLDLHTLILLKESIDSTSICCLAPNNEAWAIAKITHGFRELFLTDRSGSLIIFKIDENSQLFYDQGIFWIEKEDGPLSCTPELFAGLATPPDTAPGEQFYYFFILNRLFSLFPENESIISIACKQNHIDLIKHNCFALLNHMNAKGLISYGTILADKKVVWWLLAKHQYDLVKHLLNDNLLTKDHFQYALTEGLETGINSIWGLIYRKHYELLEQIIAKNLLTSEILLAAPALGYENGKNSVWLLIITQKYDVLEKLIAKDLLTPEMLLAAPHEGTHAGINCISILSDKKPMALLHQLLAKKLITQEQFDKICNPICPERKASSRFFRELSSEKQSDTVRKSLLALSPQEKIARESLLALSPQEKIVRESLLALCQPPERGLRR